MKKKRIILICEIVILGIFVLLTIEDAAFYTISKSNVENQAVSAAENNGMKNTKVLKISDQGSSLIVVVQNQEKYGFVAFNQSNLYGLYRLKESVFLANDEKELTSMNSDANNLYVVSLKPTQNDISVSISDKQSRWQERFIYLGIVILIVSVITLLEFGFKLGLKPSHES